jgi:hypothetical protein
MKPKALIAAGKPQRWRRDRSRCRDLTAVPNDRTPRRLVDNHADEIMELLDEITAPEKELLDQLSSIAFDESAD